MRGVMFFVGVALLTSGCERPRDLPELAHVSGVVTLDGAPLEGADVMFFPDSAKRSQGRTDENGRFELHYQRDVKGAVVGRHTVVISKMATSVQTGPVEMLPLRYSGDSKIRRDVEQGANVIDFELESDGATEEVSSE